MAWDYGFMDDETGIPIAIGGGLYMIMGWFKSSAATTGGDIDTGFPNVKHFYAVPHANAVGNGIVVSEVVANVEVVMPGVITIVTDAAEVGRWMAIGN